MKNKKFLYILIISLPSSICLAQDNKSLLNQMFRNPVRNAIVMDVKDSIYGRKIKYYHVEEVVSLKFGGYKTIYDVSNPKMINTYDLGENGKRTVTPVYGDVQQITEIVSKQSILIDVQNQSKISISDIPKIVESDLSVKTALKNDASLNIQNNQETAISNNSKATNSSLTYQVVPKRDSLVNIKNYQEMTISDVQKKKEAYLYIDVLKAYKRMYDKGYVSEDILKKIGNSYFYNNEFDKAEKLYSKLFTITTNVEPEYYYRYSIVLKSIGDNKKAEEYLKSYNKLSGLSY